MTQQHGEALAPQVPVGPPWSLDAVADVHAGVFPPDVQERLLAQMAADPEAAEMLAALGSVVDELSLLPAMTMPPEYAARLDAAITAEATARAGSVPVLTDIGRLVASPGSTPAQADRLPEVGPPVRPLSIVPNQPGPAGQQGARYLGPQTTGPHQFAAAAPQPAGSQPGSGQVVSLDAARSRRRRSWLTGVGLAAAVAAVATVVIVAVNPTKESGGAFAGGSQPTTVQPAPTSTSSADEGNGNAAPGATNTSRPGNNLVPSLVNIDPADLQKGLHDIEGKSAGSMSNPIVAATCLAKLNVTGDQVLGVTDVRYQGKTAIGWALKIPGDDQHAELVIVAPGCGSDGAQVLLREQVTR